MVRAVIFGSALWVAGFFTGILVVGSERVSYYKQPACTLTYLTFLDKGPYTCEQLQEAENDALLYLSPRWNVADPAVAKALSKARIIVKRKAWWTVPPKMEILGLTTPTFGSRLGYLVQVNVTLQSLCHEIGHVLQSELEPMGWATTAQHIGWKDAPLGPQYLCDKYEESYLWNGVLK